MKVKRSALILLMVMFVSGLALHSYGQATVKKLEKANKKPAKMEKSKVPAVVTDSYFREFPMASYDSWYGYPSLRSEYDWYAYDPYLYEYEHPEYYIVEFTQDQTKQKAIYSKVGKRLSVHKTMVAELPKAITDAVAKSSYKTWTIAADKEEIFKDPEGDQMNVYKIEVDKGKLRHHLFYQKNGRLMLDKTIKS
jgi:hypothetical protein